MAFIALWAYKISATTTASTALRVVPAGQNNRFVAKVFLASGGSDTAVKFGDGSVAANATDSSGVYDAGNFIVTATNPAEIELENNTHVSADTTATTATVYVVVGVNK